MASSALLDAIYCCRAHAWHTGNAVSDADDVLQNAAIRALSITEEPRDCIALARTCVHTAAWDAHKAETRAKRGGGRLALSIEYEATSKAAEEGGGPEWLRDRSAIDPACAAEAAELHEIVAQAVGSLQGRYAEAVQLRYLEELSVKEIADRMGCTSEAVAGVLKRALQKLRESLQHVAQAAAV